MTLNDLEWDIVNTYSSSSTWKKYINDFDSIRIWKDTGKNTLYTVRYNSYDVVKCTEEKDAIKAYMQVKILINAYGPSNTMDEYVSKGMMIADQAGSINYESQI